MFFVNNGSTGYVNEEGEFIPCPCENCEECPCSDECTLDSFDLESFFVNELGCELGDDI